MFLLRKLGKLLRGNATPFQVFLAAILGALLGFAPGFARAPGLIVALAALLLVFQANLLVDGIVGGLSKLLSLVLLPVAFAVGRFLLDGPARPLFEAAVNAPVLAWFGLEHYVTAGGLVLGLLVGVLAGFAFWWPLAAFRRAMGKVEGTERYQKYARRPWVRLVLFLFFGGRHKKKSYTELAGTRLGNPIRIAGVVVAAVLGAGLWFLEGFLSEPTVKHAVVGSLEAVNGATVDLGGVELDLGRGRFALHELALADREDLASDLFRARLLEGDLSTDSLLRRRFKIDRIVVADALHGAGRATPATPIGAQRPPAPPPAPGEKTLEDYLESAKAWKERLAQVRDVLQRIEQEGEAAAEEAAERPETRRERLERIARERGYAEVVASHLLRGAPRVEIGVIEVTGMHSARLPGRAFDLRLENLSSNPARVEGAPRLVLRSQDGAIDVDVSLGTLARTPVESSMALALSGFAVDAVAGQLGTSASRPLEGGTLDASLRAAWTRGEPPAFAAPLQVVLHDTTLRLPQGSAAVAELSLPIRLSGPLADPRVEIDGHALADALAKAGAKALADNVRAEADRRLADLQATARETVKEKTGELREQAAEKVGEEAREAVGGEARKALEGLLGGRKKKDGVDG